jgi:hypothetical protein
MRESRLKTCAFCGRRFRTSNPRRELCFECLPPEDGSVARAFKKLKR